MKLKKFATRLLDPNSVFSLLAFITPLLSVYLPLSLAIVLPVGAVLSVACCVVTGSPRLRVDWSVVAAVGGLIGVAMLSVLWSHSAALSLDKIYRTALAVLAGLIFITAMKGLDDEVAKKASSWFVAAMIIALTMVIAERVSGGLFVRHVEGDNSDNMFINQFNRPLSLLSIFIWPTAVILAQRHRIWAIGIVVLFVAMLSAFSSIAAIVAVGVGAVVFAIVYMLPRIGSLTVGVVLAVSVLLAPTIDRQLPSPKNLLNSTNLPRSAYHRLLIWDFATARIDDRPFLGWGFNTSRAIPGGQKYLDTSEVAMPLHPHNAALQWRLELGILGAMFGAGVLLVATKMASRYAAGRVARAGAVAAIAAVFAIAMLSFGAWQTWWVSGMFLIGGVTVLVCRHQSTE